MTITIVEYCGLVPHPIRNQKYFKLEGRVGQNSFMTIMVRICRCLRNAIQWAAIDFNFR